MNQREARLNPRCDALRLCRCSTEVRDKVSSGIAPRLHLFCVAERCTLPRLDAIAVSSLRKRGKCTSAMSMHGGYRVQTVKLLRLLRLRDWEAHTMGCEAQNHPETALIMVLTLHSAMQRCCDPVALQRESYQKRSPVPSTMV